MNWSIAAAWRRRSASGMKQSGRQRAGEAVLALARRALLAIALLAIALLAALSGCATTQSNPQAGFNLNPYDIKFSFDPNPPAAGGKTLLRADITGEPQLTTRAEISFEVKKIGVDKRDELAAERKDKGVYTASYTFQEAGAYQIVVHVITRSLHQVKTVEVQVK